MEPWIKISMILCFFGFLKEFRPSESYVTKYLNGPPMNFTLEEIYSEIYPMGTYGTMVLLIIIFLITDYVRYKPIIILNGVSGIVIYTMLIVCRKKIYMLVLEIFYGLFIASDVAYFTYIYSKVDKSHYQEVTGHTWAAFLFGKAFSAFISQILISSGLFSYYSLNFFTLGGMILATFWACLLPSVDRSIYFHRQNDFDLTESPNSIEPPSSSISVNEEEKVKKGLKILLKDCTDAFTNSYILKWAIWWALATCGYYQAVNYVQVLWEEVILESNENEITTNLNGAVDATYSILSGIASFGCGKIVLNWEKFGPVALCLGSVILGIVLYFMSQAQTIWLAYGLYIIIKVVYHAMITIANSEVAKNINPNSYGLIFGITTFVALVLQTILTVIVNSTLSLPGRTQFLVYSIYFIIIGVIFAFDALSRAFRSYSSVKTSEPIDLERT